MQAGPQPRARPLAVVVSQGVLVRQRSPSVVGRVCVAGAAALALLIGSASQAPAAIEHPTVVSENPADHTPQLAPSGSVNKPLALAVAQLGDTMYVGGKFDAVQNAAPDSSTVVRQHLVAFGAGDGAISGSFAPVLDGPVYALLAVGDSVYVGGSFDTVNGVDRPAVAKLDAQTGALDPDFDVNGVSSSRVSEIRLVNGRLILGGTFRRNLMAVNLDTGRNTGYIDVPIDGKLPLSRSKTEVYRFAVNPAGTRLVGVGNFTTVAGQNRKRVFMLNLDPAGASLSGWYYPPLDKKCLSNTPTRQAYVDDVDFSPNGDWFVLVSTGYVPATTAEIGTAVCDAAARFETSNLSPVAPTWINYTGGDTLHSVAVTGAAVYVQGHNRWLDNPYGRDSAGPGAVVRRGIGAIHPVTGQALPWNPPKPARQGGQDFLATTDGLWVMSDSEKFKGEYHRGIAFVPLP